ncbi:MAG: NlpC/P60 family protein [Micrococcaceae bacterium]
MKSNSVRKLVLLATATSAGIAAAAPAHATEAATTNANVGNTAQVAPQNVVNVSSDVVLNVARTPYTAVTGNSAATATANDNDYYSNSYWQNQASSNGWSSYWYYDANGNKQTVNGSDSSNTSSNTASTTTNNSTTGTDTSNSNSSDYWAQQAASNGWGSYWYYDANGNKQTVTNGTDSSSTTGTTTNSTTGTGTTTDSTTTTTTTGTDTTGTTTTTGSSSDAASVAASYVGSDYYAVGTCTGFTSMVYNQVGIELPTGYPADQAAWALANGATLTTNPVSGDLVIQEDGGSGSAHAGIYAGDGNMYAATNPEQGVMLQPVSWGSGTSYYHFS